MKVLLCVLAVLYVLSPYDLFPDLFAGVGWLDDIVVLGALWWYLYVYRKRRYGYQRDGAHQEQTRRGETWQEQKAHTEDPKDPYTILGVARDASQEDIRSAYRRLAGQYHPDKVLHLGKEFRDLAEIRFKEIQAAYDALKTGDA
ncbi:MAG: DnaJ domain-containing protein [Deltaproteobacteria bacterium]|jgi:hypothetical protein